MKELFYNLLKEGKSTEELSSLVQEELNMAISQLKSDKEKEEKAKIRANEIDAARKNVKIALRTYILTLGVCDEEILTTALSELDTMLLAFEGTLKEIESKPAPAPKKDSLKIKLDSTMGYEELMEQFKILNDYLSNH